MLQNALYLIPVPISDAPVGQSIPEVNLEVVRSLRFFIVENVRTARRFLRRMIPDFDIDGSVFFELNGHTDIKEIPGFLDPLRQGNPMGVMSEAGCPAVADPGALPVSIAQREGFRVVPLVGPSSILLALMASGFNGQGFSFNGYLPIGDGPRTRRVRELEALSEKADMTQIFIETPYRNNKLVAFLAKTLRPHTLLCVACDLTDPLRESVITLPAKAWRTRQYDYDKRPAIFLIYTPPTTYPAK
ncbi:MAG: SAM-dependent methyltransferase [Clostridium sp.]|nr:SAM-dependent methyltransferase [Prevotella sp.]MCM1428881.1 SAM-dependent methyltransferase [Clostridium sp.]MCM1475260.1 SAM-dependent methyltransferase [Muribaculaceae bacterium]